MCFFTSFFTFFSLIKSVESRLNTKNICSLYVYKFLISIFFYFKMFSSPFSSFPLMLFIFILNLLHKCQKDFIFLLSSLCIGHFLLLLYSNKNENNIYFHKVEKRRRKTQSINVPLIELSSTQGKRTEKRLCIYIQSEAMILRTEQATKAFFHN